MQQKKQIQLQFRLKDVRLLQFVNLSNGWPEGDMQIGNQIQFNADTAQRMVMCNMNVEYKKNDLRPHLPDGSPQGMRHPL